MIGFDPWELGFCHWEWELKSPWYEWDLHYQRLSGIIIWLCLKRTGNYKIHEFDWLKSILTAV